MIALLLFISFVALLWGCAWFGATVLGPRGRLEQTAREEFNLLLAAALTLVGLIIGFSFSMATSRYDLRKADEAVEANAIGTEYLRAGLLPAANTARVRALLHEYLDQRVQFYTTRDRNRLSQIDQQTARTQAELWSAVEAPALAQTDALKAIVVVGMNDVINSQGYTLAAWRNRIPLPAWAMMIVVAMLGNAIVGFALSRETRPGLRLLVLPVIVSTAWILIADIDSPRGGVITVIPENLLSLAASLR